MKFLVTKDLAYSKLFAYLMGSVVIAILMYVVLDIVMHSYVIGLDITSIKSTLLGNVETFEEPILIDSLLLQVHIDLFMTLFTLLILSSIYIRLYSKTPFVKTIIHSLFLLGIFTPIFLLLAYYWFDIFVYLWLLSFLLWHIMAFIISLMLLKRLDFT